VFVTGLLVMVQAVTAQAPRRAETRLMSRFTGPSFAGQRNPCTPRGPAIHDHGTGRTGKLLAIGTALARPARAQRGGFALEAVPRARARASRGLELFPRALPCRLLRRAGRDRVPPATTTAALAVRFTCKPSAGRMQRMHAAEDRTGTAGRCPATRRATRNVQRVCWQTVKYSETAVLHDSRRRDADLGCTWGDSLSCRRLLLLPRRLLPLAAPLQSIASRAGPSHRFRSCSPAVAAASGVSFRIYGPARGCCEVDADPPGERRRTRV